ncbi:Down syndrome cell adhesion molecule-like protein [Frankliniella fusca]|uniref:Down syndrome cell adhesion molecule-like protein n=1 Tax=Frankliniella fusca TaxID=407009 RepID=A0AAE1HS73_9NEOP|nr:Down syndrome cell adhesion molecule-like protein [Frankliniella fusca]KAK3926517.1 Down syndrome cell adhesion molecule-like protein [Frankliniella fusca]
METFYRNLCGLLLRLWRLLQKEENALALLSSVSHSFFVVVLNLDTSVATTLTTKTLLCNKSFPSQFSSVHYSMSNELYIYIYFSLSLFQLMVLYSISMISPLCEDKLLD